MPDEKMTKDEKTTPRPSPPPTMNPPVKPPSQQPTTKPPKTRPPLGQYVYLGQDANRFLFQDRTTKKCYTVEKTNLEYRGEHGFRDEVLASLQK